MSDSHKLTPLQRRVLRAFALQRRMNHGWQPLGEALGEHATRATAGAAVRLVDAGLLQRRDDGYITTYLITDAGVDLAD